eukprot:335902_1
MPGSGPLLASLYSKLKRDTGNDVKEEADDQEMIDLESNRMKSLQSNNTVPSTFMVEMPRFLVPSHRVIQSCSNRSVTASPVRSAANRSASPSPSPLARKQSK